MRNFNMVVIIGGGAAGMMAAGTATRLGHKVVVLEHSRKTLLKLGITGKGRCNLTNNCDLKAMVANTVHGGKFLYGAFSRTLPSDVMAIFEELDVPLKTERGNRVFPVSDHSFDIVDALRKYARDARIDFADVKDILVEDGHVTGVMTDKGIIRAEQVILATGGRSYTATGSDGSGYAMAERLGHTIVAPEPSLVPLNADPSLCNPLSGLSLKNVKLTLMKDGKKLYSEQGEMLFTHTGVSGPLVLTASTYMRGDTAEGCTAELDLKPALNQDELDARLVREFDENANVNFSNLVPKLLPKSMTRGICMQSGIEPGQKVNLITRAQRLELVRALKHFSIGEVTKRGFDEAVVTAGGVSTAEVNPKTMESKLVKGLYFAGEIIDADAFTGGFNLQIAWATGRAAANGLEL